MVTRRQLLKRVGFTFFATVGASLRIWQQSVFRQVIDNYNLPELRPFQKKLKVQNVDTLVLDVGQGPSVLFFHGTPDTSDVWAGSILALKDDFRCIAFDMPGFGKSHATQGEFNWSLQNRADFVCAILDQLRVSEHAAHLQSGGRAHA